MRKARSMRHAAGLHLPAVTFNPEAARLEGVTDHMAAAWAESFPSVAVAMELVRAETWLLCNPGTRPAGNLLQFLNARFARVARLHASRQGA